MHINIITVGILLQFAFFQKKNLCFLHSDLSVSMSNSDSSFHLQLHIQFIGPPCTKGVHLMIRLSLSEHVLLRAYGKGMRNQSISLKSLLISCPLSFYYPKQDLCQRIRNTPPTLVIKVFQSHLEKCMMNL